jgi:hypothetical protein
METNVLWRRDIFILAVKVVLPAKLTRSGFVTLLFSGAAMVASLCCSNLLSSHLVLGILARRPAHIAARRVGFDGLCIVLLVRRDSWRLELLLVGMRRTDDRSVAIGRRVATGRPAGDAGTVLWSHSPWRVATMLHRRRFGVNAR